MVRVYGISVIADHSGERSPKSHNSHTSATIPRSIYPAEATIASICRTKTLMLSRASRRFNSLSTSAASLFARLASRSATSLARSRRMMERSMGVA